MKSMRLNISVAAALSLATLCSAKPSITWTLDHSTLNTVKVFGTSGFGCANNTSTGYSVTPSPTVTLNVTARYDVTGSTESPTWGTKFATLSTSSATLSKTISTFYIAAMKAVSYRVYYNAEKGSELWNGTETISGVTLTYTAQRDRDYFVDGPEFEITISDAPGDPG